MSQMSSKRTPKRKERLLAEPLLKPADVARMLCVSRATVYSLMSKGSIEFIRVAADRRIRPAAIERYLQRQLEESSAA